MLEEDENVLLSPPIEPVSPTVNKNSLSKKALEMNQEEEYDWEKSPQVQDAATVAKKPGKFIRCKNGAKVPLQRVTEMENDDKEKVATLKKQENYNLVKSEESL